MSRLRYTFVEAVLLRGCGNQDVGNEPPGVLAAMDRVGCAGSMVGPDDASVVLLKVGGSMCR